jgi:hypothetical protein
LHWVEITDDGADDQNWRECDVHEGSSWHFNHAVVFEDMQQQGTFCPYNPKEAEQDSLFQFHERNICAN